MAVLDETGAPSDTPAPGDTSAPADDLGRGQGEILPRDYSDLLAMADGGCSIADIAAYYGTAKSTTHKHLKRARAMRMRELTNSPAAHDVEDVAVRAVPGHEPTDCEPPRVFRMNAGYGCRWEASTWLVPSEYETESESILPESDEPVEHVAESAMGLDAVALSSRIARKKMKAEGDFFRWAVRSLATTGYMILPPEYGDGLLPAYREIRTPDGLDRNRLYIFRGDPDLVPIVHALRGENRHRYLHLRHPRQAYRIPYRWPIPLMQKEFDEQGRALIGSVELNPDVPTWE